MKKKKDLDAILQEKLETGPSIKSYTVNGFSITNDPELLKVVHRWHIERLEARGIVEPFNLWQGRIYKRRKVKKVRKK